MSKDENKDTRTLLERAEAWNRGEFDAMPQWDDPDDITLAQPGRPTTKPSTPRSSGTRIASS